jgi:ABC-type glutathione transport system ATPase component
MDERINNEYQLLVEQLLDKIGELTGFAEISNKIKVIFTLADTIKFHPGRPIVDYTECEKAIFNDSQVPVEKRKINQVSDEVKQKINDKFNTISDEEANTKSFLEHYANYLSYTAQLSAEKLDKSLSKHYNSGNGYGMNRRRN